MSFESSVPLGFNRTTLIRYGIGSAFVLLSPISLVPLPAHLFVAVLVYAALCVGFLYVQRGQRFWALPAVAWGCFLSLMVGLNNAHVADALSLEGETPLTAEQLIRAPKKRPFFVEGVVIDSAVRGDWKECRSPLQNDPYRQPFRYNTADPKEVCNSASVLALRSSSSSEVVAWVLRDRRPWPRFFGEGAVLAFTMDLGGLAGSRSIPADLAREAACLSWSKKQEWGELSREAICPADAPILRPVAQEAEPVTVSRLWPVSVMIWQIYSVCGWFLVGAIALRRRRNR